MPLEKSGVLAHPVAMKRPWMLLLCAVFGWSSVQAQDKTPAGGSPATTAAAVKVDQIPSSWFYKAKGYEKALALQKETGADLFIVFTRDAPSDQKGLCEWFRQKGLENNTVKKFLKNYTVGIGNYPVWDSLAPNPLVINIDVEA